MYPNFQQPDAHILHTSHSFKQKNFDFDLIKITPDGRVSINLDPLPYSDGHKRHAKSYSAGASVQHTIRSCVPCTTASKRPAHRPSGHSQMANTSRYASRRIFLGLCASNKYYTLESSATKKTCRRKVRAPQSIGVYSIRINK